MPGDRDNAPATLETKISTNNAEIHPPSTQDKTLLGPGQKAYRGISSHQNKKCNSRKKRNKEARCINLFNIKPCNIHQ